eukprot:COSAG01_NODE_3852_length_5629_cov_3.080108_1_plen_277_part_00
MLRHVATVIMALPPTWFVLAQRPAPMVPLPEFPSPAMRRTCPKTSAHLKFLAPQRPGADCAPPSEAGAFCTPPPCGGGCTRPGEFCNLDTKKCEKCLPRYCCVTMPASLIMQSIVNSTMMGSAGSPHTTITTAALRTRLKGAVVVVKQPCPRNYHCEEGRVDDFRLFADDPHNPQSQCYAEANRCSRQEGCAEGSLSPTPWWTKLLALLFALLWLLLAKFMRCGHKAARSRGMTPLSRRRLASDNAIEMSLSSGLIVVRRNEHMALQNVGRRRRGD